VPRRGDSSSSEQQPTSAIRVKIVIAASTRISNSGYVREMRRYVPARSRQHAATPPSTPSLHACDARPSCDGCVSLRARSRDRRYQSSAKISALPAVPGSFPCAPTPRTARAAVPMMYEPPLSIGRQTRCARIRVCTSRATAVAARRTMARRCEDRGNKWRRRTARKRHWPVYPSPGRILGCCREAPPVIVPFPGLPCSNPLADRVRQFLILYCRFPSIPRSTLAACDHCMISKVRDSGSGNRKHRNFSRSQTRSIL